MILFRLLLAPVILLLAYFLREDARAVILISMYLGLISDILDGIIARKYNVASERLRRMDSQIDMIFWVSIAIATWIIYPSLVSSHKYLIGMMIIMELTCYLTSFVKFGKETCTHAFLSKLWGITLLIAFTSLIGFAHAGIPFYTCIVVGFISYVDVILIILILPKWTHDVPSAYHAYLIRKGVPFERNKYFN